MSNQSNWKNTEREVAGAFGTTRAPVCNNLTHSDTFHNRMYIEIKKRKSFSLWTLFRDVEKKAKAENKTPVLAIKEKGKHGFLVMCRPEDLKEISNAVQSR